MLALVQTGNIDSPVKFDERPDPDPAADQLLIKVEAFSLNRADFLYLRSPGSDWRVGVDFVGTVIKPTSQGNGPKMGARVLAHNPAGGGGAQLAVAPARHAVELPAGFDTAVAASLPLAGLVALRLIREAHLQPGQRVLITGATGGVGPIATELAIRAGAVVTALVPDLSMATRLRELGASIVSSLDDVSEPFDVVLESIGGEVMAAAIAKLRRRGLVLWFGQASGQPVTLNFFSVIGGQDGITLRPFVYNAFPDSDDQADLAELIRLVAAGELHPEIGYMANWSATGEALKKIAVGELRGKAVFTVDQ